MAIDKFMSKNISDLSKIMGIDKANLSKFMGNDISTGGNPDDISGLVAGYRADDLSFTEGQGVTSWTDRSINSNDLDTNFGYNAPICHENEINGRKAIYFAQNNNIIGRVDGTNTHQDSFTMALVCQQIGTFSVKKIAIIVGDYSGGREWSPACRTYGYQQLTNSEIVNMAQGNTVADEAWHVLIVSYDADSNDVTFYKDGNNDGGGNKDVVWDSSEDSIQIGARKTAGSAPIEEFKGYIADVWYYDHVLSTSDRSLLDTILQNYYGL